MYEVAVEHTFAAAHALRGYKGACENVHGHNFRVRVTLAGERLNETGFLVDFVRVQTLLHEAAGRLDHRFLNEVAPFDQRNPTAENLAEHFYSEISRGVADSGGVRVSDVTVWECDGMSATYREDAR
jgi:6-pyruvoyltetrahydropterin/6-carboxytetrahydropterin synthase